MAETSPTPLNANAEDSMPNPVMNPQNSSLPKLSSPSPSSSSVEIPQLSSPPLNPLEFQHQHQHQQLQQGVPQGQNQNLITTQNFQIQQSLQRTASIPRVTTQIQQQYAAIRQQQQQQQQQGGGLYTQMSFSGANTSHIQQQQLQQQQHLQQQQAQQQQQQQLQQQQRLQQQQLQHQSQQQLGRSGLLGQVGPGAIHLPMLQGQAGSAQYNMQNQVVLPSRQKASLMQNPQYHAANPGQQMQIGVVNQLRANPSYSQQRMSQAIRQQQIQHTGLPSPQKLQAQTIQRPASVASMNAQLAGMTQNGQSPIQPNSLQQQQWLKQMQPAMSVPGSSYVQQQLQRSHQQQSQQQALVSQQLSSSPQMHHKSMHLTPQQMALVQQQINSQQSLHQQSHMISQQHMQQQQSPRTLGASAHISASMGGSQIGSPGSGPATPGGSGSQVTEVGNQLLGKRKIQDLVSQIDPRGKLDPEVVDILYEVADDFIDSVTTVACSLAKHRKSSILESKDLLLHLEKNWKLHIPGFTSEERKHQKTHFSPCEAHQKRLEMVRVLMDAGNSKKDSNNARARQAVPSLGISDHQVRASPSSEQLLSSLGSPMMTQKYQAFG